MPEPFNTGNIQFAAVLSIMGIEPTSIETTPDGYGRFSYADNEGIATIYRQFRNNALDNPPQPNLVAEMIKGLKAKMRAAEARGSK